LLRRGRRPAVRRQRRGARQPHQRRALQAADGHGREHRRHCLSVLFDHAEGRSDECPCQRRAIRRSHDLRARPSAHVMSEWKASPVKRLEAAAISTIGYRVCAALGATLRWRVEGLQHYDDIVLAGHQPIMAFWHGRILPATVYFKNRGIVVITSENFDGEWI